ncbi:MAG: hypothetical protein JKY50_12565 [Oleispira sp.]|nr:hypothetical protein [Oleispira sp.]MBL4882611.1 hypothetical protein [Oleispira sp.]
MKKIIYISLLCSSSCFALLPIQDDDLSVISGQSGITIDIDTNAPITIGEFRYNDTDNGALEEGGGGSFSLRDIEIKESSFSFDIDVSSDGELFMKLNNFATMDMSIGAIQFNYDDSLVAIDTLVISSDAQLRNQYSRLGSLFINDYTLAATADITFKLTNDGGIALTSVLPTGSFFYLTYTDDGEFIYDTGNDGDTTKNDTDGKNYISARVEFDDFKLNDIKLKGVGVGDDSYLEISLGGTQGAISFSDININGSVIGSAGFENIHVEPVSYLHIKGHQ